jgi:hypothetical protein
MAYDFFPLRQLGISRDDAEALRRISMTLSRWHELECGDGNDYGSWAIARGRKDHKPECPVMFAVDSANQGACNCKNTHFVHDDDGKPFLEHHHYLHGRGKDYVSHTPMPDRERGALKRLAAIMSRYPDLSYYVQGDPRGAALYILKPGDVPAGQDVSSYYSRGVAVYK